MGMDAPLAEQDPREASARVVESALALVRAELKLLGSYTKGVLKRAGVSLFLAWLAITLGQVALVLAVLSPILLSMLPWPTVVSAIGIAVVLAAILAAAAALAFRSAKRVIVPAASAPVARYENAGGR